MSWWASFWQRFRRQRDWDRLPPILTWWQHIGNLYPDAERAEREIRNLKAAGVTCITVPRLDPEPLQWLKDLIKANGMKKLALLGNTGTVKSPDQSGYYAGDGRWLRTDAVHTSASQYPTAHWRSLMCHSQPEHVWDRAFEMMESYLRMVEPDYVVIDHEVFQPPEMQEELHPGIVWGCRRCGSVRNAKRNWARWTRRHDRMIKSIVPSARILYFLAGYYYPNGSGHAVQPAFYWASSKSDEYLENQINNTPWQQVRGGHPWLMFQPYKKHPMPTPEQVERWCRMFKAKGARGFSVYADIMPSYFVNRLIAAGSKVFREGT